ncbi:DNA kinase/phosphatase Pnk1 [Microbotryomycetes sp. JL221]|nr:DNA kinase/phosphatase Pnk1 [Microbotryomycetes sp. JL221]
MSVDLTRLALSQVRQSGDKQSQIETIVISDDDDDAGQPGTLAHSGPAATSVLAKRERDQAQASVDPSSASSPAKVRPSKLAKSSISPPADVRLHPFRWQPSLEHPTALYGRNFQPLAHQGSVTIAAFDLDGTIIKTNGNYPFAKSAYDWRWLNSRIVTKIREQHQQGRLVVFVSNQNYTGKRLEWFKLKLVDIARQLQVPLRVCAATEKDGFRKPEAGMWRLLLDKIYDESGASVDMQSSFFVGDAAGRAGDHSRADIGFAVNARLEFFTPEQFFQ